MGSFFGHALPGTFFWIYGLWYLSNVFYHHFKYKNCEQTKENINGRRGRIAFTLKFCCCVKYYPLEGILKMVVTLIGMSVESLGFFWGFPAMYQHFTMYASFCVAGLIDILMFYDFSLPNHVDYFFHIIGFFLEGLLFAFHLHGRSHLDIILHTLLVYTCYFCSLTIIAMLIFNKNMIFQIMFAVGTLVQGSWFWQAGQILYPVMGAKWSETDHNNMMLAVLIFCWHVILNSLFSVILFMIVGKVVQPATKQLSARYQHLKESKDDDVEDQSSDMLAATEPTNDTLF